MVAIRLVIGLVTFLIKMLEKAHRPHGRLLCLYFPFETRNSEKPTKDMPLFSYPTDSDKEFKAVTALYS